MAAKKRGQDWCVLNSVTQAMECKRCGESVKLPLPMKLETFAEMLLGFARAHRRCKPTGALFDAPTGG